jgi:SAM-dependent methyltransferase
MPFRESFDCLWCGRQYGVRDPSDLEGWAQLCPDCVGRAGENAFLRFRVKAALAERATASAGSTAAVPSATGATDATNSPLDASTPAIATASPAGASAAAAATASPAAAPATTVASPPAAWQAGLQAEMVANYAARAPEYDDFYLRRGRYQRGPIHDTVWQVELDVVTRWLDEQPIRGEIVELAAGTGWWSPLLAQKGELWAYDAAEAPLDKARDRLLAHRLRAHLHVRDAWAEPDRQVDSVFSGFWLSHVPRAQLAEFLNLVRRWLKPGGGFFFIDSRRDPQAGPEWQRSEVAPEIQLRSLDDGRQFRVVKVFYEPAELADALRAAGFVQPEIRTTDRFFVFGSARDG